MSDREEGYRAGLLAAVHALRVAGHVDSCAACHGGGLVAGVTCDDCAGWGDPAVATVQALLAAQRPATAHTPSTLAATLFQRTFGAVPGDGACIARASDELTGGSQEAAVAWSLANVVFALEKAPQVFRASRVQDWMRLLTLAIDAANIGTRTNIGEA